MTIERKCDSEVLGMYKKLLLTSLLLLTVAVATACGKPPSELNWKVADFAAVNQDNQPVTLDDLKGKVWLADFIFTNCTTVCLPMTSNMASLQKQFRDAGVDVVLVSFSVDPEFDRPEVLKAYGESYGADFTNWQFLTGYTFDEIKELSEGSFKSLLQRVPDSDQFAHGTSFYLVNPDGVIVKRYDGVYDPPVKEIIKDIKKLQ